MVSRFQRPEAEAPRSLQRAACLPNQRLVRPAGLGGPLLVTTLLRPLLCPHVVFSLGVSAPVSKFPFSCKDTGRSARWSPVSWRKLRGQQGAELTALRAATVPRVTRGAQSAPSCGTEFVPLPWIQTMRSGVRPEQVTQPRPQPPALRLHALPGCSPVPAVLPSARERL